MCMCVYKEIPAGIFPKLEYVQSYLSPLYLKKCTNVDAEYGEGDRGTGKSN